MATTLDTFRSIVTDSALQVVSKRFEPTQLDHAIRAAGSEFVRRTRCVVASDDSLTLTVDSAVLDYSGVADFNPSRFIGAALLEDGEVEHLLTQADYRHVQRRLDRGDGVCDRPMIAFREAEQEAVFSFNPEQAWGLRLTYWQPFTTWTIGTVTPASVTLNIPDDLVYPVAWFGAASYLVMGKAPDVAAHLRTQFEHHIRISAGQVGPNGPVYADEDAYL